MVYATGEHGQFSAWDTRMTTSLSLLSFEGLSKPENEWAFYSAHGLEGTRFAVCESARIVAAVCDDDDGTVHIWDCHNGGRPLRSFSVFSNRRHSAECNMDDDDDNNSSSSNAANGGEREMKRAKHRRGRDEVLQRVGFCWASSSSTSCGDNNDDDAFGKQCETPGMWVKSNKAMYVIPLGYVLCGSKSVDSDYSSGGDTDSESCAESDLGSDNLSNSSDSNNNMELNMNAGLNRGQED